MRLILLSVALLGGMYLIGGGMQGDAPLSAPPPVPAASASLVGLPAGLPQAQPAVVTLSSTARHLLTEERPLGPSRPVVMGEAQPLVQQAVLAGPEAGELRRVSARVANVRSGPSTRDQVVGRLSRGEEVLVLNRAQGWLEVAIEGDGLSGWVAESLFAH